MYLLLITFYLISYVYSILDRTYYDALCKTIINQELPVSASP